MLTRNPFIVPMVPTLTRDLPTGDGWQHEVKFDGFRVQLHADGDQRIVYSRNGHDFTKRFSSLQPSLAALPIGDAIIDAELVACDESGQPDFKDLMRAGRRAQNLCCWCFDLLRIDGEDLRRLPLSERRERLSPLINAADEQGVQFSLDFDDGSALLTEAAKRGLEGIVSKRRSSLYKSGRTRDWLKIKTAEWRTTNAWRGDAFNKR